MKLWETLGNFRILGLSEGHFIDLDRLREAFGNLRMHGETWRVFGSIDGPWQTLGGLERHKATGGGELRGPLGT